ncbi:MAG TPA: peptidoglycan editing factor PgeF [Bacillota bacterium]|nr:peptidoglycan editing factor PgeF [Bacillota bacterium]
MEPFQFLQASSSLLTLTEWEKCFPNLVAGFTTRMGGQSQHPFGTFNCALHVGDDYEHVIANRQLLCDQVAFEFDKWTSAEQVHGNRVAIITGKETGKGRENQDDTVPDVDGLLTNQKGVLLTSFYADCVPIWFIAPSQQVIGIAHAGWRGTASNISQEMLDALINKFQVKLDQIQVAIGPSIGGCCYEVSQPVVDAIKNSLIEKQEDAFIQSVQNEKYLIDLKEANRLLLLQAGLREDQIYCSKWCTSCRTDLFYSYRKDGGKTGRMTAYIGWREEE